MPRRPRTYEEKRDPSATTEPFGEGSVAGAETWHGAFVVHLHDATRRHYDLRVEARGVLASFAVPKGPSLDPSVKHLAVHTEDHPLEYLDFEDVIPEGSYGGGPMIVWDRGAVRFLEAPSERGLDDGKLDMVLSGRKLRGRFALVRLAPRDALSAEGRAWLLFKKRDEHARDGGSLEALDRSVLSGLTLRELEGRDDLARGLEAEALALGSPREGPGPPPALTPDAQDVPRELEPATLEVELEGLPARVRRDGDEVTLLDREDPGGRDLASFYPEIVRAVRALPCAAVTLEGTIVAFDDHGRPSVPRLSARAAALSKGDAHRACLLTPVTLVVHDLLTLGRAAVDTAPLAARRALLRKLVRGEGLCRVVTELPLRLGEARALLAPLGVARVIARRAAAPYAVAGEPVAVRVQLEPTAPRAYARVAHGAIGAIDRAVRITNPGKIYFPERGFEKARVVGYYRDVAHALLPHVRGRPVTLVRYPDGIHGKHFFQWNVPPQMPSWMRTVAFKDEDDPGRPKRGFLLDDVESLLYVANLGAIPIHVFSCRAETLATCDYVAIDFDVKRSSLATAVTLALSLRAILAAIGLEGFAKTSGQSGLHVLVPLGPGHGYDTARALVELLGRLLVSRHPDLATMERLPAKRGDKVYVDTVQTGPTRTLVAPYSLRAVPEATVSTPLEWSDVTEDLDPRAFDLPRVPEIARSRPCPMARLYDARPDVPRAADRLAALFGQVRADRRG